MGGMHSKPTRAKISGRAAKRRESEAPQLRAGALNHTREQGIPADRLSEAGAGLEGDEVTIGTPIWVSL